MDLNKAITGRRAVREYTGQAVDDRTIRLLIDAAVQAPSAVNQQPWMFTVVRDQSLLDRISHGAKSHMLATMSGNPHAAHFQPRLSDPEFHIFYHAPVLILISAVAQGPWIVEDCALAAENLMLAAYAAGLGSCWIGFAQGFSIRAMERACWAFQRRRCRLRRSSSGTRRPRRHPLRATSQRFVGLAESYLIFGIRLKGHERGSRNDTA